MTACLQRVDNTMPPLLHSPKFKRNEIQPVNPPCKKSRIDFSNGEGFYLSHKIDCIAKWALTKFSLEPVTLLYEFDIETSKNRKNGLFLEERNDSHLWEKIIKFNRKTPGSGKGRRSLESDVNKAFKDKHFIYGPVCDNYKKETPTSFEYFN